MIYTVTFNPAIDLVVQSELHVGELNRASGEDYFCGGRGINISVMAHELGADTIAAGFVGGFTGNFIKDKLDEAGVKGHFLKVGGTSRINVKVIDPTHEMTEINLSGVHVTDKQFERLEEYFFKNLKENDALVLAGNAAEGIEAEDYAALGKIAEEKKAILACDTNELYVRAVMPYKPFLVKPNVHEMTDMFRSRSREMEDLADAARKIRRMGARNVLISNGRKGAVLAAEDGIYYGDALEGDIVSTVGAGDSMVAGFLVKYMETQDYKTAFEWAIACAGATSFSSGLGSRKDVEKLVKDVCVVKLGRGR